MTVSLQVLQFDLQLVQYLTWPWLGRTSVLAYRASDGLHVPVA